MSIYTTIIKCRICKQNELLDIINLGEQYITSRFPLLNDYSTLKTPIELVLCKNCGLVQLKHNISASELYEHEYGYRSSISNTMKQHLINYQNEVISKINLNDGDTVIDIGSNDATTLNLYSNKLNRIGVDPVGKQFKNNYKGIKLIDEYFTYENVMKYYDNINAKIISSIAMFYDLPDPVQFAKDIYKCLHNDGIWTCEQSYLLFMLDKNSIDTICHEHLEYYSLIQIKKIADISDFNIIDIKFNEANGGSFRIYFAKKTSTIYKENTKLINKILQNELKYDLFNINTYTTFINKCKEEVNKLNDFINIVNKNKKKIYIYGASTKGNCLLQFANIDSKKIKYAVERNLNKVGKMTITGSEIISEETMRKNPPDYLLVLPWHFKNEIIQRENKFLEDGGMLIFPFPKFEIYSKKKKCIITGIDGMLSKHLLKLILNEYSIFGFGYNKNEYNSNYLKFYFDINNNTLLENYINIITPDIIIHLAGISFSPDAISNPLKTLYTNGMTTANICDIIYRYNINCKLFNASSSEIYKGHINYTVKEDDLNMYHLHPYSIAKILGHNIVDYYRKTYNLHFSNGILFTVQSPFKKNNFILNKISIHANNWKHNKKPLLLGNLDSYRMLLHADDVATAIYKIINHYHGDNYIISGNDNVQILDLVFKMYKLANIILYKVDNILYEHNTNIPVIIIDDYKQNENTNIKGYSYKLKKLGFTPKYNTDDILYDIFTNNSSI